MKTNKLSGEYEQKQAYVLHNVRKEIILSTRRETFDRRFYTGFCDKLARFSLMKLSGYERAWKNKRIPENDNGDRG